MSWPEDFIETPAFDLVARAMAKPPPSLTGTTVSHYRVEVKSPDDAVWSEIRTRELEEIRQFLVRALD